MSRHYVCSECGYFSHFAGTCQNDVCLGQSEKLTECHCEDDLHSMVLDARGEVDDEEMPEENDAKKKKSSEYTILDLDNEDGGNL